MREWDEEEQREARARLLEIAAELTRKGTADQEPPAHAGAASLRSMLCRAAERPHVSRGAFCGVVADAGLDAVGEAASVETYAARYRALRSSG